MAAAPDQGKIFINYRRSDSPGIAGRLDDSLTDYFGEDRVFRDVDDITAGANFESVLHDTIDSADAIIVLIGPNWLSAVDDKGNRRLDDPNDWVTREIASALEKDLPVFPVLIETTPMPRAENLPESLTPLVRLNALHISDRSWESDVRRLAKVVAFDIPGSVEEKKLNTFRLWSSLALLLTLAALVFRVSLGQFLEEYSFISLNEAAFSFVPIGGVSLVLALSARMVDATRRKYIEVASWLGGAGTVIVYIAVLPVPLAYEAVFVFFFAGVIAASMLFCMTLSGFKPR